jgi:hypothetical protein
MKKLFFIAIALLISLIKPVSATNADSTKNDSVIKTKSVLIWVRKSDIPPAALQKLENDSKIQGMEKNIEKIGQYVSIGKEIGSAVDTSLGALASHIDKISQTNVGKFTMFMVAWKILGDDLVGYLVGIITLAFFLTIWVWSWRSNFYRRSIPTQISILPPTWYRPWKKKKVLESKPYEFDKSNFKNYSLSGGMNHGASSYLGHIIALLFGLLIIFLAAF